MRKLMLRLRHLGTSGATLVEYSILLGVVSLVAIGAITATGGILKTDLGHVKDAISHP